LTSVPLGSRSMKRRTPHSSSRSGFRRSPSLAPRPWRGRHRRQAPPPRCQAPPCRRSRDGDLGRAVGRRRHGHDPPHVHRHLEAEQVDEEVARLSGPIGLDVGYRPASGHAPYFYRTTADQVVPSSRRHDTGRWHPGLPRGVSKEAPVPPLIGPPSSPPLFWPVEPFALVDELPGSQPSLRCRVPRCTSASPPAVAAAAADSRTRRAPPARARPSRASLRPPQRPPALDHQHPADLLVALVARFGRRFPSAQVKRLRRPSVGCEGACRVPSARTENGAPRSARSDASSGHKADRDDKLDHPAGEPCILLQLDWVYRLWRKW
jgi:hypothetical protein